MNNKIAIYIVIFFVVIAGIYYFSYPSQPAAPIIPPASGEVYNVSIVNYSFDPASITVAKGDIVVWTNQDSAPHQIVGGNIDSPVMSNGQSYSYVVNDTGTIDYHCSIHPSMKGTIIVK